MKKAVWSGVVAVAVVFLGSSSAFAQQMVNPPASNPDAPYRVRIGMYETREEAQAVAATLEAQRGEKLWVTKEK